MLVAQSYNIFNRYGKDVDALKDITRAFIEDLSEFSEDQITNAFKAWRRKRDGMPAPSNIIEEIKETKQTSFGGLKTWGSFEGSWKQYLDYLETNNAISNNFTWQGGELKLRPGYVPEWTMKDFK